MDNNEASRFLILVCTRPKKSRFHLMVAYFAYLKFWHSINAGELGVENCQASLMTQ